MKSQTHTETNENQENDFLDAVVATSVVSGIFFAIFVVATIIQLMM